MTNLETAVKKLWDKVADLAFGKLEPTMSEEIWKAKFLADMENHSHYGMEIDKVKNEHKGPFETSMEYFWMDHSGHNDFYEVTYTCEHCSQQETIQIG